MILHFSRLLFLCSVYWLAQPAKSAEIAIVIDDLGNQKHRGEQVLNLPGPLTLAFLPHRPFTPVLAKVAHRLQKEVIVHLPMSSIHQRALGRGALIENMPYNAFRQVVHDAIESVPHARGVNNHMGSALTRQTLPMRWLMTYLSERQLFFLDSRTSSETIAEQTALAVGIPVWSRHVFLDHDRDQDAINRAFDRLIQLAQKQGYAVAIGHPYSETIAVLQQRLPKLAEINITLRPLSSLAKQQPSQQPIGRPPEQNQTGKYPFFFTHPNK